MIGARVDFAFAVLLLVRLSWIKSRVRPLRVARDSTFICERLVVIRAIPIAASFPNVAGHVVKAGSHLAEKISPGRCRRNPKNKMIRLWGLGLTYDDRGSSQNAQLRKDSRAGSSTPNSAIVASAEIDRLGQTKLHSCSNPKLKVATADVNSAAGREAGVVRSKSLRCDGNQTLVDG
jgi:hypothetical protein